MLPFRYRKPGYVALNVTDIDKSVKFYRDLVGLQLEAQDGQEVAFLRCSEDHHNVVLYRAEVPGIKRMAFELESEEDLELAARHIQSAGWTLREVPDAELAQLHQGRTFRFQIPESTLTFEFYARMERGRGDYVPTVSQIQRLGHVVIRCADRDAVLKTLTEKLNFKVSDHFGDQVAFLRCFPNPYHHTFGLSRGDVDGLHHVNFMVTDVDDVGRAMNRMRKADVKVVYGPGRHDISNSIFIYFLDPDGLTTEYSFGMEEFPEDAPRAARQLPLKPEILDSWGGAPAPGFGSHGAVEAITL
uniref:VOC family protein n=1 Tax=Rhodoferax sp. TaxID=50421 RepID=UPI00272C7EDC|nr:VOC family protein [Rhodoferax sp.]